MTHPIFRTPFGRREKTVRCHLCGFRYRPTETKHSHDMTTGKITTEARKAT